MSAPRPLEVLRLGRCAYEPVWRAMQAHTDARGPDTADQLWLVEHEPVFTLGQAGKPEHVLAPGAIPVLKVDRGGQVTYHGPGQVVAYPLLDLRRLGFGVRELVERIEDAGIAVLAAHGLRGERRPGAPGVYVAGAKVMALGLRVRRGCSFHGLAFNVAMDLAPYRLINPCGFKDLEVTDLNRLGSAAALPAIEAALALALARAFGLVPVEIADARARLAAAAAA